ncbi:agmatine deiminase family protein, partial [Gilvimarinus sp. 1_MG-2023]
MPTYNDVNDAKALEVIGRAFADFVIIGIDCRVLIKQLGSLD